MCLLGTSPGASDLIPETLSISRKNTRKEVEMEMKNGNKEIQKRPKFRAK